MPSAWWKMMYPWSWVAGLLSIIGALNWGFVGLFNFNLVRTLFGPMSWLSRFIYTLVGISGLYLLMSYWTMYNESRVTKSFWQRWFK
ncbi:MAG: DUF378 domain-containing protein [Chloroflexota bacterium]